MNLRLALARGLTSVLAALLSASCSGGAADDPRCVSICEIREPSVSGAGDVCSAASAERCREECGARIAGTTAPCGSCLLEDADFGDDKRDVEGGACGTSPMCPNDQCTLTGPAGECQFCMGDKKAEDDCLRKVSPRREIECKTEFRDAAKCSALCAAK